MMKPLTSVRMATLDAIIADILPNYLAPVPPRLTVREWFDRAGIPRFKANPAAKRGGGTLYYSVPAVEKYFERRTGNFRH